MYHKIVITLGNKARKIAQALRADAQRAQLIEDLLISCPFDQWQGIENLQPYLPAMSRLHTLRLETPDCNTKDAADRVHWRRIQAKSEETFRHSSLLNVPTGRRLAGLRSCTIHFVDHTTSLYILTEYSSLLLHPSLESLSLSCAAISSELTSSLAKYQSTTALKSLKLEQCDFSVEGLKAVLSVPASLKKLHVSENFHPPTLGPVLPSQLIDCLSPQVHSLSELTLLLAHPRTDTQFHLDDDEIYDLKKFESLTRLHFGQIPFYVFVIAHADLQDNFHRRSRINLNRLNFPPNLEVFKYSNIQTYGYEENIEKLQNTFFWNRHFTAASLFSKSLETTSHSSDQEYRRLRSVQIVLPLHSRSHVDPEYLRKLARPAADFLLHGIRFQVYDTDEPRGYIPPFLYGEFSPSHSVMVDSYRIIYHELSKNDFSKKRKHDSVSQDSAKESTTLPNEDKEDTSPELGFEHAIYPPARYRADMVASRAARRVGQPIDVSWLATLTNGAVEWQLLGLLNDPAPGVNLGAEIPDDDDLFALAADPATADEHPMGPNDANDGEFVPEDDWHDDEDE
ncbi:hypothetical protein UCRPC4_g02434 [Phaeomoniella chlamydospora]|uniref:Uncharacterized protein n=1 Tax=Phaeomoniella chlamydospora TaxID=158046 RepID=A0A0G2EQR2_PHACM|nr:hypothetical protein UCRPC4_g02434 [Phaeomoniella chlamydospora]